MHATLTQSLTRNRAGHFSWCWLGALDSELKEKPAWFTLQFIAGPETLPFYPTSYSSVLSWEADGMRDCINQYLRFLSPFDSLKKPGVKVDPQSESPDFLCRAWRPLTFLEQSGGLCYSGNFSDTFMFFFFLPLFLLFVLGKQSIDLWLLFFNVSCEKDSAHLTLFFLHVVALLGLSALMVGQV